MQKLNYLLITGSSGCGKDTVVNYIVNSDMNKYTTYKYYTTRPPRNNYETGYYFLNNEKLNVTLETCKKGIISDRIFTDYLWRYVWVDNYINIYLTGGEEVYSSIAEYFLENRIIVLPVTTTQIMDFLVYISLYNTDAQNIIENIFCTRIVPDEDIHRKNALDNRKGTEKEEIERRIKADSVLYTTDVINHIKAYGRILNSTSVNFHWLPEIINTYDDRTFYSANIILRFIDQIKGGDNDGNHK